MSDRLVFGEHDAPMDPKLCVTRVRGRDGSVLTQDLCLHPRGSHATKGAGCTRCACPGFASSVKRP